MRVGLHYYFITLNISTQRCNPTHTAYAGDHWVLCSERDTFLKFNFFFSTQVEWCYFEGSVLLSIYPITIHNLRNRNGILEIKI